MSDNWMIVLAKDALALPPRERAEAAMAVLLALRPQAGEPELHYSETPEYFHCCGNFSGVYCPFCQKDVGDWWGVELNRWAESGNRREIGVTTPCCGRATTLNDLDYVWPHGLACVAFEIMERGPDLEPEERRQIEEALGLPVRVIWQHI